MTPQLPDWKTIPKGDLRDLLSAYCADGLSAQQIADKFQNCSRSAAIGMISRLKLQLNSGVPRRGKARKAGVEAAPKPPKPPAAKRASKLVQQTSSWRGANNPPATDFKARAEQRAKSPGIVIKRENAFDPIPDTPPVAFGSPGCRWPVDGIAGQGLLACGAAKLHSETPYCTAHSRLASAPAIHRLSVPKGA